MEAEAIKNLWTELGALGFLIAGLTYAVCYFMKSMEKLRQAHTEERKEWRIEMSSQNEKVTEVVETNTTALVELCTLIKSQK